MNNPKRAVISVCHLTTVHARYDTRIFIKECTSLAQKGYETYLIVADGKNNEYKNGVKIYDIGLPPTRINRILFWGKRIFHEALALEADIYHFHDPELLNVGRKLAKKGKTVIYDSHEDVPRQVLDKAYIPFILRRPLSWFLEKYENKKVSNLAGVVTVTPYLEKRFLKHNNNVVQVRNFPLIEEFATENPEKIIKENAVCYVGAISKVRGVLKMVEAMQYLTEARLLLGGKFENEELRNKATSSEGWDNVDELGFLSREEVKNTLQKSVAGLVVLKPTRSYIHSIPVKMFEYMVAGIPIIASDFKYWRELIEEEDCALFVNPEDSKAISKAIDALLRDKLKAENMGKNGKKAVLEKFNWRQEEQKLIEFYESIRA